MGRYLPKRVLSNAHLEEMVDTSDEWITSRTGMKERRLAAEDECTSDMGTLAGQAALEKAGITPDQVDLIVCATLTPDYIFPSTASLMQARLGCSNAAAMDVQAACTGYIYALSIAKAMVESGAYRNVLIIASEKLSTIVDYKDRNTCILFGDGASACVVSDRGGGYQIMNTDLGSDGSQAELLILPGGGAQCPATKESVEAGKHFIQMDGREVFKHAVRRMEAAAKSCIDSAGINENDIQWLIPHQANVRIIESIAKRFRVPMDKVFLTIQKYGNTSASSVGIALDELTESQKIESGDHLLLVAFGAGLTWGASVLKKVES